MGTWIFIPDAAPSEGMSTGCSCGCFSIPLLLLLVGLLVDLPILHGYFDDWSDLMCLVESGDCTVQQVDKAVADGEQVNFVAGDGKSALWVAATHAPSGVVAELIKKGAKVDVLDDKNKRTPLMQVLAVGTQDRAEVVNLLIKAGSNINQKDENGDTPLHLAIHNSSLDSKVILLLLKTGKVKVESPNGAAMTPLMVAAAEGRADCVKMLLACKASVKAVDNKGNTALLWAVLNENERCAALLMQAGADPARKNNKGESAVSVAKESGNADLIRVVIP